MLGDPFTKTELESLFSGSSKSKLCHVPATCSIKIWRSVLHFAIEFSSNARRSNIAPLNGTCESESDTIVGITCTCICSDDDPHSRSKI